MSAVCLYRFYGEADRLLYVGISRDPLRRLSQHARDKELTRLLRIDVEWLETRRLALIAERHAIKAEHPEWNVLHSEPPEMFGPHITEAQRASIQNNKILDFLIERNARLDALNAAAPKEPQIAHANTYRKWRKDGFPGL